MLEFGGISVTDHGGVGLLFVGFVLSVVGFSCPYWTGYDEYSIGLWLVCSPRACRSVSTVSALFGGWWSAVQFFQCVSLVCFLVTTFPAVLVTWITPCCGTDPDHTPYLRRSGHRLFLTIGSALAGFSGLLGDFIFLAKVRTGNWPYSEISWAFVVNVVGCVLAVIAFIVIAAATLYQKLHPAPRQTTLEEESKGENCGTKGSTSSAFVITVPKDTSRHVLFVIKSQRGS